jgi:hypothetical protein
MQAFTGDLLYLSADLLTGKSIPVLVGITRLPIDQFLAGVVLSMGAAAGALFTAYSTRTTNPKHPLARWNSVLQAAFALFLSLSLLLSLARGIHFERGIVLSLVPAFCLVAQSLPQGPSTPLVALLVAIMLVPYCATVPVAATRLEISATLPTVLHGLNTASLEDEAVSVWDYMGRAVLLAALAFYASVQHAPIRDVVEDKALYASQHFAHRPRHTLLVCLVSAWVRVCVWYSVCHFQDNTLHVMLENDRSRGDWDWRCCVAYSVALLYSACWIATQLREQLLPGLDQPDRLKLLAAVLALAALFRMREPLALFTATLSLAAISVSVPPLTSA